MTDLAQAIARHTAAQAALDDASEDIRASRSKCLPPEHLSNEEDEALYDLAETPCAGDAEFIEKLRYLYAHQARIWGPQNNANDYGCLAIAMACHLGRCAGFCSSSWRGAGAAGAVGTVNEGPHGARFT
jgi:hypothetical protein